MKAIKRLAIFISVLLLLEGCVSFRPQGYRNVLQESAIKCPGKADRQREKRQKLLFLLVLIPATIWLVTPKPLK